MDTGWGGENIILFRGAADRLGLKVRPYQGTGVGQIPFAVTEKCVVKLRWSFWSVTRVVGESGVIEWPSHVTQAIEDRFGERGFDGFVPWGLVSDKTIELDASNQTVRFLNKVPKEAAGWTKLALRKDWGILALETENPDGGKGVILVDTGSASGVGLATQKGREWKAAHTNQPVRLIMGYMVQPGLIVREQAWSDELSLGDLKLTDVVIEEADTLSLEKTRTVESMQVNRNGSVRPRFHCHGHVVLCVLVSMAHLCGSASGRPAASANNAQSGRASVRKVDFSEVPEVKELAQRARRIGNEMFPKIVALLADGSTK